MEKSIQALIKNSPLALIVIGLFLVVMGAASGWKSQGLEIQEMGWRIALGVMGGVVAAVGSLLEWRSRNQLPSLDSAPAEEKYGITINKPLNNSMFGSQFELSGTYDKRPPHKGCAVVSLGLDNHYHFKQYINFENSNDRTWSTMLHFGSRPGRRVIKVVTLGKAGQALADYQHAVQRAGYWIGIDMFTPDIAVCASITIEWKPDPSPVQRQAAPSP
jgi:hypothetical protein